MRIIAGTHRGRALVAPGGQVTRPTADRARQALFNVLEHAPWAPPFAEARVLDLFAGSGALGLEALSRGAARAVFVETDPAATRAVSDNLATLGLEASADLLRADATRLAVNPDAAFDLAFLDPPYAKGLCEPTLERLAEGGWLGPDAIVVLERGAREGPPSTSGYAVVDDRVWGVARIWFLKRV